jgi:hypothetical protein
MFLHLKPRSDFAVLQTVGDEADHIFFATRQQGLSCGIVKQKMFELSEGGLDCSAAGGDFHLSGSRDEREVLTYIEKRFPIAATRMSAVMRAHVVEATSEGWGLYKESGNSQELLNQGFLNGLRSPNRGPFQSTGQGNKCRVPLRVTRFK